MPRQVVLIMTDTQRWNMLGCYGSALKTPCLDRLAAEGLRFERAYTCQPVCGPARAALFTGQWPHTNGGWANNIPMAFTTRSLGQRLQEHGVHAAYIGKWHLDGSDYFGTGKAPDGWDPAVWYDMRNYLEELSPEDRRRSRDSNTNRENIPSSFTFAHRCSDRAIDFLEKHRDEDFLLVVSYDEPHGPCLCPQPYADMYRGFALENPPNVADTLADKPEQQRLWAGKRMEQTVEQRRGVRIEEADFFGCHSYVDSQIGRVLDAVDAQAKDALVIYTADHGAALQSHRISDKGAAMYDEVTRIPLLVRWPGHAAAGSVSSTLASHIDITPTILEAFDIATPRVLEGRSILRSLSPLQPVAAPQPAPELPVAAPSSLGDGERVFIEFGRYEVDHDGFGGFQPIRCVVGVEDATRYKLVINLLSTDELYDLDADPYEMTNLIESSAHVRVRNVLHDGLLAWMNQTRDPFRGYCWERRAWRTDARPATYRYTRFRRQRYPDGDERLQLDYDTGMDLTAMEVEL